MTKERYPVVVGNTKKDDVYALIKNLKAKKGITAKVITLNSRSGGWPVIEISGSKAKLKDFERRYDAGLNVCSNRKLKR